MKKNRSALVLILVIGSLVYYLNACSHSNITQTNKPPFFDKKPTITVTSKLLTSKQLEPNTANNLIWLPNGQGILLVTNTDLDIIHITASKTLETERKIQADTPIFTDFSASSGLVAWADKNHKVSLWIHKDQTVVPIMDTGKTIITGLAFAPTQNLLALAEANQTITIWNAETQQQITSWQATAWLTDISFSPDSQSLAGVSLTNFTLEFFDVSSGETKQKIKWGDGASAALYNTIISPDWQKAAWVSQGIIQIMEIPSEKLGPLLSHEDYVSDVAWSPDSLVIAVATGASIENVFSPVVQLWDIQTGDLIGAMVQEAGVVGLDFSPDGRELAILLANGKLTIWSIN